MIFEEDNMDNFVFDTNVFFAYADEDSKYHMKTHFLFDNDYELFSSKKVKRESQSVIRRHGEILTDLSESVSSGESIEDYLEKNVELENDKRYFAEKIELFKENNPKDIIRQLKDLNKLTELGVGEAFQRIINELINDHQNIDLEQALRMHITNREDRHILVDVVCWHDNSFECHFLTADSEDFLKRRRAIRRTIANCINCEIGDLLLKIISYRDIK